MPGVQSRDFDSPDETRTPEKTKVDIVRMNGTTVGRFAFEPGWRWSDCVKPVAGTESCQARHVGVVQSGRIVVQHEDGTELELGPGDAYIIEPGHDAWVVGDEPWCSVEFASAKNFGVPPQVIGERILATILFVDIVDSTATAQRLGDHAWAQLVREHNQRIRAAVDRHRGREIDCAGDGLLAMFDGAARAVHAAALMDPAVADLGVRVRIGLHTGEVEVDGGRARGVAVHAAARIAALSAPGEVLVSGTTRDMLDGSGLGFESRGEHELKGLTGRRPVFALQR